MVKPIKTDLEELYSSTDERVINVQTKWMNMTLDHFNPLDTRTFKMRYMINDEFVDGNDRPIFIFVGGAWSIRPGWLLAGNMYKMAQENLGFMVYTEHRYYGETQPFQNTTPEDYRFLNANQALADLAVFIRTLKQEERFVNSKVILYGPSYAGNLVLWFKQRYPHLAFGSIASGSPIKAEMEFSGYLEIVERSLRTEGGDLCTDIIGEGIREITTALQSQAGRDEIYRVFNLCQRLVEPINVLDLGTFSLMLTREFGDAVETARPGSIIVLCDFFQSDISGTTPMEKIAGFINLRNPTNECRDTRYNSLVNYYRGNGDSRSWLYQTCTEFGYFQIAPTSGTLFDSLIHIDVHFYVSFCRELFSNNFTVDFLRDAVERVNLMFAGLNPVVNNTINIHGELDPWRALGVYNRDLGDNSPTYNIARASHHFDIMPWLPTDTITMTNAQQRLRRTVSSWLS